MVYGLWFMVYGLWLIGLTASILSSAPTYAQDFFDSLNINSFGDARLRYHTVDQEALPDTSEALSLSLIHISEPTRPY